MSLSTTAVVTALNLADGIEASRKMLKTLVNVGERLYAADGTKNSDAVPVWEWLGDDVESSSISYGFDSTTTQNIKGVTRVKAGAATMSQEMSPMVVTGGAKLTTKILDILARGENSEFGLFEVMVVKDYITVDSKSYAEVHKGCSILPESEGGDTTVGIPVKITFSNDRVLGSYAAATKAFAEKVVES